MRSDETGEQAQVKLRRKLHPFLLRRLKQAGILNADWARRDPDLACLHQDPDFLALIGSAPVA